MTDKVLCQSCVTSLKQREPKKKQFPKPMQQEFEKQMNKYFWFDKNKGETSSLRSLWHCHSSSHGTSITYKIKVC